MLLDKRKPGSKESMQKLGTQTQSKGKGGIFSRVVYLRLHVTVGRFYGLACITSALLLQKNQVCLKHFSDLTQNMSFLSVRSHLLSGYSAAILKQLLIILFFFLFVLLFHCSSLMALASMSDCSSVVQHLDSPYLYGHEAIF